MNCPICNCSSSFIKEVKCGNFDQSILYNVVKVNCCDVCGHIFNELTPDDKINLNTHYLTEYSDCHNFNSHCSENPNILEINQKDLRKYLTYLTEFNSGKINLNKKFDMIILDQLVEHLVNPLCFFNELGHFLKDTGVLKISCPNSLLYLGNKLHFPDYNFIIREHIQHFDYTHLVFLLGKCGFSIINVEYDELEIIKNIHMPNMSLSFIKNKNNNLCINDEFFELKNKILTSKKGFDYKLETVDNYYCYGIGREFLYMLQNKYFSTIKLLGLIDTTPIKQKYTINGMEIYSENIIKKLTKKDTILITAFAHKEKINKKIKTELMFDGTVR